MGRLNIVRYSFFALAAAFSMLLFYSCSPENESVSGAAGTEYFPLDKGSYIVYNVRDINHKFPEGTSDTTYYRLKELVADTFTDAAHGLNYRLERYKQSLKSDSVWTIDSVWSAKRTATAAVKTENNLPYIKLVFPLKNGLSWNGNAFLDSSLAPTEFWQVTQYNQPLRLSDSANFPLALKVVQRSDSNCILKQTGVEYYAAGIGLVYKELVYLDYKQTVPLCQQPFTIEIGHEQTYTYLKHGRK